MPELVEVELFAHHLKPLISSTYKLTVECPSKSPPKNFLSKEGITYLQQCTVNNVERKGKLIRLHLQKNEKKSDDDGNNNEEQFMSTCSKNDDNHERNSGLLYFHMGMTGRISTPEKVAKLESLSDCDGYPPPHTHLILKSNGYEIAFSDPRKFGAVCLNDNGPLHSQWGEFAQDALDENASTLSGLIGQKKGIKAILLDQRAVISGVGNWIADEVLYQSKIHPDQNYLMEEEVDVLQDKLRHVLSMGIQCSKDGLDFPEDWIFHSRWNKRSKEVLKDKDGHKIEFVQSGGRTSAFVPKIQKKSVRKSSKKNEKKGSIHDKKKTSKRKVSSDCDEQEIRKEKVAYEQNDSNPTKTAIRRSSRLSKRIKSET